MILDNQVRAYRLKAGMSQTELARRVCVAGQNLSAVERGRLAPWPKLRKAVSVALGVPEDELFSIEGEPCQISKPDFPSEPGSTRNPIALSESKQGGKPRTVSEP